MMQAVTTTVRLVAVVLCVSTYGPASATPVLDSTEAAALRDRDSAPVWPGHAARGGTGSHHDASTARHSTDGVYLCVR